jgi:hypothetical protein
LVVWPMNLFSEKAAPVVPSHPITAWNLKLFSGEIKATRGPAMAKPQAKRTAEGIIVTVVVRNRQPRSMGSLLGSPVPTWTTFSRRLSAAFSFASQCIFNACPRS